MRLKEIGGIIGGVLRSLKIIKVAHVSSQREMNIRFQSGKGRFRRGKRGVLGLKSEQNRCGDRGAIGKKKSIPQGEGVLSGSRVAEEKNVHKVCKAEKRKRRLL